MKVAIDQRAHLENDDTFERAMERYDAACEKYETVVCKNAERTFEGNRPSLRARRKEERAFDELGRARHALFTAAASAFPTLH